MCLRSKWLSLKLNPTLTSYLLLLLLLMLPSPTFPPGPERSPPLGGCGIGTLRPLGVGEEGAGGQSVL